MKIEQDDFDAWRANPITRLVMDEFKEQAEEAKNGWLIYSWEGGHCDATKLYEMRGRYDGLMTLVKLTLVDLLTLEDLQDDDDD
jgi:hypothetical protein